MNKTLG